MNRDEMASTVYDVASELRTEYGQIEVVGRFGCWGHQEYENLLDEAVTHLDLGRGEVVVLLVEYGRPHDKRMILIVLPAKDLTKLKSRNSLVPAVILTVDELDSNQTNLRLFRGQPLPLIAKTLATSYPTHEAPLQFQTAEYLTARLLSR